ncbi:hypothetical protein N9M83_00265 [Candidatus Poseidonia alphae]|nr:hypothetical protein [Candidatus Poseidonia alphae]
MGGDGGDPEPKLNIRDSVVMGDINIHTSDSDNAQSVECVNLNLPTGNALVSFINDNWLDILEKHTTENISLSDHGKVLVSIKDQIMYEYIERKLCLRYREIIRKTLLDNRSMNSPLIQSELGIMNALTNLNVNEFNDFRKIITEVRDRITSISESDTESIGLFAAFSERYEGNHGYQDLLSEICADSVFEITSDRDFMGNHGDWLVPTLLTNHNFSKRNPGQEWSKVRLDRGDDDGTFMFEKILIDTSTNLHHFENIMRIVFSPELQIYPPESNGLSHITYFDTVTYSIRLATIKCAELLRGFTPRDEQKIEDFWTWLNLISFVSTFHVDKILSNEFNYRAEYSLSKEHANNDAWYGLENVDFDNVKEILPDIERLFSVIEKVSKQVGTVIQSRMRKMGRAQQASSILNSINAAYFLGDTPGDVKWELKTDYMSKWFSTDRSLVHEKDARGLPLPRKVSPEQMPVFWSGNLRIRKHPGFNQFFTEWQSGKSFNSIL